MTGIARRLNSTHRALSESWLLEKSVFSRKRAATMGKNDSIGLHKRALAPMKRPAKDGSLKRPSPACLHFISSTISDMAKWKPAPCTEPNTDRKGRQMQRKTGTGKDWHGTCACTLRGIPSVGWECKLQFRRFASLGSKWRGTNRTTFAECQRLDD